MATKKVNRLGCLFLLRSSWPVPIRTLALRANTRFFVYFSWYPRVLASFALIPVYGYPFFSHTGIIYLE
jgi:hypothetical protein